MKTGHFSIDYSRTPSGNWSVVLMNDRTWTRDRDDGLTTILYETEHWAVDGMRGVVFCDVAGLRSAVERASQLAAEGHHILAIVRRPPTEINVYWNQIVRLADRVTVSQDCPIAFHAAKV
jgi:hypothetical protein